MSRATIAERYRAHAVLFRLAQELRCTPKEAEAHLEVQAAQERLARTAEARRRLEAKMNAPLRPRVFEEDRPERSEPWMMRD